MVTEARRKHTRALPLALKFFLATAFCVLIAILIAITVTWLNGRHITAVAIERSLATSTGVQKEFETRRLEQLQAMVQLIAADASFVKYIAAVAPSASNLPGLAESQSTDDVSVPDLLRERQTQHGFDFGAILDVQGNVLARTDRNEAYQESLAQDPLVQSILKELHPFSGYWQQGDGLYQAAIMPLAQGQDVAGYLLLALRVDNAWCRKMAKISGSEMAYWLPQNEGFHLVATSLDDTQSAGLREIIKPLGKNVLTNERRVFEIVDKHWTAQFTPVAEGAHKLGAVLTLVATDAITADYRNLLNLLVLAGLASLALALLLSYLLSKGILRPVREMATAAERAVAGDYTSRLSVTGKDELARLSHAFDALLAELREKNDIQGYVQSLARHLPEPEGNIAKPLQAAPLVPMSAPIRESVLLAAWEFSLDDSATADTHALLSRLTERLTLLDKQNSTVLMPIANGRVLIAWREDSALEYVLAALHILHKASFNSKSVLAMMTVVHGQARLRSGVAPLLLGKSLSAVERLLAEAGEGQILLAKSVAEKIQARYGASAVGRVASSSGKQLLSLVLENIPAPYFDADIAATVVLSTPALNPLRPTASLSPGSVFGGRYRILSVLGSGGMGVVYKAQDIELDDLVALKTMQPRVLADPEQYERLKSELKLARRITHSNVLRTFDFGESEGQPYISMEYVRGLTLRYLLQETGSIPFSAALRIARQLSAGLAAVHEIGVLHRDIKPENLILESNGNVKLMDFGIARPIRRAEPGQTQPGMFVGTPHYAAPEQLAGEEVDQRADIYACGVVMCEMFCGRVPFSGANTMEIYIAQMSALAMRPTALKPDLPVVVEMVILKCLALSPADRYQSAVELRDALDEIRL